MAFTTVEDLVTEASNRLSRRLTSESQPDAALLTALVDDALFELSQRIPRVATQSLSGVADTWEYSLSSWSRGLSRVLRVECPTGNHPPTYLHPATYEVDAAADTLRWLTAASPDVGSSNIKVWYTLPWTATAASVAALDILEVPAVLYLCAHYAGHYAVMGAQGSPEIAADAVDLGDRPTAWRTIEADYRRRAQRMTETTTAGGFLQARHVRRTEVDLG